MNENLDMDGLRAFVAIADTMSFSRAGAIIGRSQPTVSLRLQALEKNLGVSLLIRRQGRVLDLTDDGRALLAYARRIIDINDQALRDLGGKCDRIRVGLPADFADIGLGPALRESQSRFPGVRLELETDVSFNLHGRCLAGDLDIVFYKGSGDDSGLTLRRFTLAWAGGVGRAAESSAELRIAAFPEGCAYRRRMVESLGRAGLAYRVVLTTASDHSLRQALAAGMAVSALPESLIDAAAGLRRIDGLPPLEPVTLAMMVAPSRPAAVARIADNLAGQVRQRT